MADTAGHADVMMLLVHAMSRSSKWTLMQSFSNGDRFRRVPCSGRLPAGKRTPSALDVVSLALTFYIHRPSLVPAMA